MTIGDICTMMWDFLPKRKRELKPITDKDIIHADTLKAFSDLSKGCEQAVKSMKRLQKSLGEFDKGLNKHT